MAKMVKIAVKCLENFEYCNINIGDDFSEETFFNDGNFHVSSPPNFDFEVKEEKCYVVRQRAERKK